MDTVLRVVVIYLFIMAGLRVLGKREFGQLTPLELVTLLIIPELVSQALTRQDSSLTNAMVGTATLLVLVYLSSLLQYIVPAVEKVISGEPSVLVRHGHYIDKKLNEERVTPEEIYAAMHESGLERIEQVRWAILESDGQISIIPEEQPQAGGSPGKTGEEGIA